MSPLKCVVSNLEWDFSNNSVYVIVKSIDIWNYLENTKSTDEHFVSFQWLTSWSTFKIIIECEYDVDVSAEIII